MTDAIDSIYSKYNRGAANKDFTGAFSSFFAYATKLRLVKNPKRLRQLYDRAQRSLGDVS